jgi:putative SOS response-associated peptidase YedK
MAPGHRCEPSVDLSAEPELRRFHTETVPALAWLYGAVEDRRMCGRYLLHADPKLIERAFGAEFSQIPRELVPRWNIAPTQRVPIVRNRPGRELKIVRQSEGRGRELATVRWGLIPAWAKDPAIGNRMINARAEGITEKPAFRSAFRTRRCIVPASGFYEW